MTHAALCVYSKKTIDDFASSWCLWRRYGDSCEFITKSQLDISSINSRPLIILDSDFPPEIILEIKTPIVIVDNNSKLGVLIDKYNIPGEYNEKNAKCVLVWKYFNSSTVPLFLEYIEDKMKKRNYLPHSENVNIAISSYERTFYQYDILYETFIDDLVIEGQAIKRILRTRDIESEELSIAA